MITRRDLLAAGAALAALPARAQQAPTQADLLRFEPLGQVTLIHVTDIHGQLMPMLFREATTNLGVGDARGQPPHITGETFLRAYDLPRGTALAHALTDVDYVDLARRFGPMGGADRIATIVKAIRAERPATDYLLLDGGDTWQGAWTNLQTKGADMVAFQKALGVEAMVGHWEFTYGADRVKELVAELGFPFLGGNIQRHRVERGSVFPAEAVFERGGVKVAVIGQAFPYTPIANPRWMIPDWEFGIRRRSSPAACRRRAPAGAQVVVLLSHNGFDVDRKLAARVPGIDVILTGHTHDALPRPLQVGNTLLIATGCHGKFVSRLDLEVKDGKVAGFRHALIPVFTNAIAPDPEMAALVAAHPRALRRRPRPGGRAHREPALAPRQHRRHLGRPDLRRAARAARRRDRPLPRLPLGHHAAARHRHHRRGCLGADRHDLSGRLPHRHEGRDAEGGAGGRG